MISEPILDVVDFDNDQKDFLREVALALRSIGSHKLVRQVVDRLT